MYSQGFRVKKAHQRYTAEISTDNHLLFFSPTSTSTRLASTSTSTHTHTSAAFRLKSSCVHVNICVIFKYSSASTSTSASPSTFFRISFQRLGSCLDLGFCFVFEPTSPLETRGQVMILLLNLRNRPVSVERVMLSIDVPSVVYHSLSVTALI